MTRAALQKAAERAREEWGVTVELRLFEQYVEARANGDDVEQLHLSELYLTCACSRGDSAAIASLERRYFPALRKALARLAPHQAAIDDALSLLRELLFVAPSGGEARITEYTGQGELAGWLKVTAVRLAIRERQRGGKDEPTDGDALASLGGATADPELEHFKARYRAQFNAAFLKAFAALTPRERNLLRLHFLQGVSTEKLAGLYQVHRATAVRWLTAAKVELLKRTRAELTTSLGLKAPGVDSVLRLIESRLDVSLSALVRSMAGEPR